MATRQYAGISPELRQILARNGLQASVVSDNGGYTLVVQGDGSPQMRYSLTAAQYTALSTWGSNSANRKAYNTFVDLVSKDFTVPRSFVSARNAGSVVNMGQNGYRVGTGVTPGVVVVGAPQRHGQGHHPVGGVVHPGPAAEHHSHYGHHALHPVVPLTVVPNTVLVAQRADGSLRPGELRSDGAGFSYRGGTQATQVDALGELHSAVAPLAQRPNTPATAYNAAITSDVYFSNDKWQEVLSSHGLIVDAEQKTLTVQSASVPIDLRYRLTDEDVDNLTANSLSDVSLQERLDVINRVLANDFTAPITLDTINSTARVDLTPTEKLQGDIELFTQQQAQLTSQTSQSSSQGMSTSHSGVHTPSNATYHTNFYEDENTAMVDGRSLGMDHQNKGWYREGANGREVEVSEIRVERIPASEVRETALTSEVRPVITDAHNLAQLTDALRGQSVVVATADGQSQEATVSRVEYAPILTPLNVGLTDADDLSAVRAAVEGKVLAVVDSNEEVRSAVIDAVSKDAASNEYVLTATTGEEYRFTPEALLAMANNALVDGDGMSRVGDKSYALGEIEAKGLVALYGADDQLLSAVKAEDVVNMVNNESSVRDATDNTVSVRPAPRPAALPSERHEEGEAKYRMTAVINGKSISHEISQKQFDKFMAVDDYHRMLMFSKIFKEVDMKTRPEAHANIGTQILAALTAGLYVASGGLRGSEPHLAPEIYASHVSHHQSYDSPAADYASRMYDARMSEGQGQGIGMGRG